MKSKKVVNTKFGLVEEKLSSASPSRPACAECHLHSNCQEPFLSPYIPKEWTGEYLFVIEVSRAGEEQVGRDGLFLSQRERVALKEVLCLAGLQKQSVAFYPVLRCRPELTGSKKPKMVSIRACRPFLLRALSQMNPYRTVAFGESAIRSLMNSGAPGPLAKLRGRSLPIIGTTQKGPNVFYATAKLSSLLVDPHAVNRMVEDLKRLTQPELEYPSVKLPGTGEPVAFDTEYTGRDVHCIGFGTATVSSVARRGASKTLKGRTVIGHNIQVDLEALIHAKDYPKDMEHWLQGQKIRDTQLEARLADENRGKHGYKLESLLCAYYNVKDYKAETEALGPDSSKWPKHLREERCRLDAWATYKVHEALQGQIEGPTRLSHAIAMSLRRMYWSGIYIDPKIFKQVSEGVLRERTKALKGVNKYAKQFNLGADFEATNDNQLREYVYGKNGVGLAIETLTKGGLPTVSVKTLKEYKDEPAIAALLSFSKYDKLYTTYGDNLLAKCHQTKEGLWLPVQINPLAAKTGRRASANPNLQNWPVSVRQVVVSRFKNGSISDNDYSKLEPILGGWVTGEEKLTEYFVKYPNGYLKIGEDFFKKSVEKNSDDYKAVKSLILAIIYNKKKWSLAEDLWVNHNVKLDSDYEAHEDKAGDILEEFLTRLFPGVRDYHESMEELVLSEGRVENALGQVRRLPLPPEPPRSEKFAYKVWCKYRAHVINQAINFPIQSLASYVTGCALVDLERAFLRQWKYTYVDYQTALMEKKWPRMPLLCIEVHDDLVQDIPPKLEPLTKQITHEIMQKPPTLFKELPELFDSNVKLTVDTNNGPTWGLKA